MALNPFQKAVEDLAKSLGLKGSAQNQVYQTPQYLELVNKMFGAIPLPAGVDESQVTSRTPQTLEYKDAQGYTHRLERDLNGVSTTLGEVKESSTARPPILPGSPAGEQEAAGGLLQQLIDKFKAQSANNPQQTGLDQFLNQILSLSGQLQQPSHLAQLQPQDQSRLDTIANAENMALKQQFGQDQGKLVADLYGRGVNQSSIAGNEAGRLLQQQGLVTAQAQSNQANRSLGLQQFLTQLGQGNIALALQSLAQGGGLALDEFSRKQQGQQFEQQSLQSFVSDLLNQALNREVSGGQLGLGQAQLAQQGNQFNKNLQLQYEQFREQQRQAERSAMWNNIFRGIGLATPFLGGIGSLFSGASGGGSNAPYTSANATGG